MSWERESHLDDQQPAPIALSLAGPAALLPLVTSLGCAFRLTSLLRLEKSPTNALRLFRNPNTTQNPNAPPSPKYFRYSARSYDIIICRLAQARMFTEMEELVDQMAKETRFSPKEALFCRIISSYGRGRFPNAAIRTFHRIPTLRCRRTIRSLNTLLDALLRCGEINKMRTLCRDLAAAEFPPDACTYNILIRAWAVSGSLNGARQLFGEMQKEGIKPTAATFGTLISVLCAASLQDEAFSLKEKMLRIYNIKPNVYIYTSLIKALCKEKYLDRAIGLKDEMADHPEIGLDAAVYTTLIRGLFREGRKGEVVGVLEEMKDRGVKPDAATYNAMIVGFCDEEEFDAAFEALREMKRRGCKPDLVSYNTIVVGMCRVGRWRDARNLFYDMPRRGCKPDVVTYRVLLDGMWAAGEGREAALLMEEMIFNGYRPSASGFWKLVEGTLVEQGRFMAQELLDYLSHVKAT